MYTIIRNSKPLENKKLVRTIPDYTFFTASFSGYTNVLWLKTFGGVVCLEGNPGTWSQPCMEFSDYCPVDVEIHVKEQK